METVQIKREQLQKLDTIATFHRKCSTQSNFYKSGNFSSLSHLRDRLQGPRKVLQIWQDKNAKGETKASVRQALTFPRQHRMIGQMRLFVTVPAGVLTSSCNTPPHRSASTMIASLRYRTSSNDPNSVSFALNSTAIRWQSSATTTAAETTAEYLSLSGRCVSPPPSTSIALGDPEAGEDSSSNAETSKVLPSSSPR